MSYFEISDGQAPRGLVSRGIALEYLAFDTIDKETGRLSHGNVACKASLYRQRKLSTHPAAPHALSALLLAGSRTFLFLVAAAPQPRPRIFKFQMHGRLHKNTLFFRAKLQPKQTKPAQSWKARSHAG